MITAVLVALMLQAQPQSPPPPKPGTVRGRVTAADSGTSLRRATVRIQSAAEGSNLRFTASTNARGQFEIKELPPGPYLVSVSRSGFLPLQYGQRRATERGLTIDVKDGATIENIDVALPRAGVMAGRIVDELGEPYPGVQVIALTPRYVNGKRTPTLAGVTTTDDIGQFRIAGLAPGGYQLVALSTETWRTDKQEVFGYASTFYPGVSADAAQRITIAPSQQRLDLDFAIRPSRAVRVSGQITPEPGAPPPTGVQLLYGFADGVLTYGIRTATVGGNGAFEIADVTEGAYVLSGRGADQTVTVTNADVTGIALTARVGSTVSGAFVTDEGVPPPFVPGGVRVNLLAPLDNVLPTVRLVSPDPSWNFKLTGLGGPFLFRPIGLPDGWTLQAVKLGERDITDVPWDVPTGGKNIDGLKLVVARKGGTIAGSVVDASDRPTPNATVVVFADDESLWVPGSRFLRAARPSSHGTFTLGGLPAGIYRVIAREFVEDGEWQDRAFLDAVRSRASTLVLGDSEHKALTLKIDRQ